MKPLILSIFSGFLSKSQQLQLFQTELHADHSWNEADLQCSFQKGKHFFRNFRFPIPSQKFTHYDLRKAVNKSVILRTTDAYQLPLEQLLLLRFQCPVKLPTLIRFHFPFFVSSPITHPMYLHPRSGMGKAETMVVEKICLVSKLHSVSQIGTLSYLNI